MRDGSLPKAPNRSNVQFPSHAYLSLAIVTYLVPDAYDNTLLLILSLCHLLQKYTELIQ